jgi:hypothetical protein
MGGIALNQNEKKVCPALKLHTSAEQLNRYVIENHRRIEREQRLKAKEEIQVKETKNKNLLAGLGISTKPKKVESKPKVEIEHKVVEVRGASLLNVKRVIKFTEVGESYTKTDLGRDLMIPSNVVEEILDFLNRHTNIKFNIEGSRYVRVS